jgi:FkbM family methyltransferase
MDVYDFLNKDLGPRFWLASKGHYRKCKDSILNAYNLWADEKSRQLYRAIIEFRMKGDYSLLPEPDSNQYFPDDLPSWRQPVRLIDTGAYDGDTLKDLIRTTYAIDAIAAFEPDLDNFVKLSGFVRNNPAKFGHNVSLYPCGVWSGNNNLCFTPGQGEACQISREGTSKIQVVALDAVLPVFSPTLIKMDIEGAEYEALLGSRQMIQQYKPGLAICLYHHPDHIWQIPLLINDWLPGYKLYMRCHAFNTFDLVLYAMQE